METEKAIEYVKELLKYPVWFVHTGRKSDLLRRINPGKIKELIDITTKQDKMIDLMAEYINNLDIDEDICTKNVINPQLCNEQYSNCKDCIKQYFENKAEESE